MGNPRDVLEPGYSYHIYNHAVGNDNLFREPRNYLFFLEKFEKWILPICDPYAWCLMPNHFHFVLRIKEPVNLKFLTEKHHTRLKTLEELITEQFGHCFNSYAQAFNKTYNRKGALFNESFPRKRILSDDYLQRVINYVHFNPVKDGFVNDALDWKYSSLPYYLGETSELTRPISNALLINEVVELFGSMEEIALFTGGTEINLRGSVNYPDDSVNNPDGVPKPRRG
jgi:REP element-mobilizing transposase RayT